LLRPVLLSLVPAVVVGIGLASSVSAGRMGESPTKLVLTVSTLVGVLVAIQLMVFLGFTLRYGLALAIPAGVIGAALALALVPSFRALILEKTADQRLRQIMGFMLSDNCIYSPSHTWTRVGIGRKETEIGLKLAASDAKAVVGLGGPRL
jgi:hydrogenase-4 membrane subunit HyfE